MDRGFEERKAFFTEYFLYILRYLRSAYRVLGYVTAGK